MLLTIENRLQIHSIKYTIHYFMAIYKIKINKYIVKLTYYRIDLNVFKAETLLAFKELKL